MFDPSVESPIPLARARLLPWLPPRPNGRQLHRSTIERWAHAGLRGVVLETVAFGASLYTSELALRRFFAAVAAKGSTGAGSAPLIPPGPARSPRRSRRRAARKSSTPRV